jgi:DNA replication protein DnaC
LQICIQWKQIEKITAKKYINARLLSKDTRFAESTEYVFQCLHWAETLDIKNSVAMSLKKSAKKDLTLAQLQDPNNVISLLKNDQLFSTFKNVRGSPPYWKKMCKDMLAKIQQFGTYTFFLTGSIADFHCPEIIRAIALQYGKNFSHAEIDSMSWQTKRNWLQTNPVTAARHIDYIFNQVWDKVILCEPHPIGQILNYDRRIEMQSRGTAHFHSAIHVVGAPVLDRDSDEEVVQFIDKYIKCQIPDEATEPELHNLVLNRQTHHHTTSCKKNKDANCRHGYAKMPSSKTCIARKPTEENSKEKIDWARGVLTKVMDAMEVTGTDISSPDLLAEANVTAEDHEKACEITLKKTSIIMKRDPSETCINPYNPVILLALRSNMDIQYITDVWACVAYITSYMCKPERQMSELMNAAAKEADTQKDKLKAIGDVLSKGREVSQHEAIYRILGMKLRKSNIAVEFFQSNKQAERTHMTKPYHVLKSMKEGDTNIFMTSLLDKYAARPVCLESMCYVEFGRWYKTCSKSGTKTARDNDDSENENSDSDTEQCVKIIKLQNNLGYMSKRTKKICPRFHNVSRKSDSESYFHRLLICYLPWRSENELESHGTYELKFMSVKDQIKDCIYDNEPYLQEVEDAIDTMPDIDNLGEIWNHLIPQAPANEEVTADPNYELLNPSNLDPQELSDRHNEQGASSTQRRTAITLQIKMKPDEEYYTMIRSLNLKQYQIHDFIFTWCMETRLAHMLNKVEPAPFHIFMSGGGGVGKSHVVHAIYQSAMRVLRTVGQNPDHPTILLTASTGKAAVNIDGTTLHSAFCVRATQKYEVHNYIKPSFNDLQTMRTNYDNLKILVIDEVSMISHTLMSKLHLTLQDIFENDKPFGGVSILAVGDLLQLPPVAAKPVFFDGYKKDEKSQKSEKSKKTQNTSVGYHSLVSSLWQKYFVLHELTEIMRQREDPEFASILSRVRVGQHTTADCEALKVLENNESVPDNCLSIYCLNMQADEYNAKQLAKLDTKIYTIVAVDSKTDRETGRARVFVKDCSTHKTGGLAREIKIATDAQYMHIKNTDLTDGLVNGAAGIIKHIDIDEKNPLKGTIYVKFYSPGIGREAKQKSKHPGCVPITATTVFFAMPEHPSVTVERTQYPGKLAWGVTVHRAQGSTYEKMIAHIAKPKSMRGFCYKPGQIYTMLSRAKTRKHLKVIGFDPASLIANSDSLKEIKRMTENCTFPYQAPIDTLPGDCIIALGHLNVRSLSLHYEDIAVHFNNSPVDILCLTETHVNNYEQYSLPGCTTFSTPCKHGCAIYTTKPVRHHFSCCKNIETTAVVIDSMLIVCVYVPPKSTWTEIQNFFTEMLAECTAVISKLYNCDSVTFIGDFNTGQDSSLQKVVDLFAHFGLSQHISKPTHNLAGVLDLLFTTYNKIQTVTHPLYFTDHHFIGAKLYPT